MDSPFLYHKQKIVGNSVSENNLFTFIEYLRKNSNRIIRYDQLYYIILTQLRRLIYENETISKEYPEFFKETPFVFSSKPRTESLITSDQLVSWLNQKFRNLNSFVELLQIDSTEISKLAILSIFIGKIVIVPVDISLKTLDSEPDYIIVEKHKEIVCENLTKLATIFPLFKKELTKIKNRLSLGDFKDFVKINETQQQVSGWITELYLRTENVVKFADLNDTSTFDTYNIETKNTFTHNFGIFSSKTIGLFELASFGQITVLN